MNSKALTQVLSTHGKGKEANSVIEFGDGASVTVYANFGGESLSISGITQIQMEEDMVIAQTRKRETFVVASEDIRALRFAQKEEKKRTGLI